MRSLFLALSLVASTIASGQEPKTPAPIAALKTESLEGTTWIWKSGGKLKLLPQGAATHTRWKKRGKWSLLADGTMNLVGEKTTFTVRFFDNDTAEVTSKGGRKTTLVKIVKKD